MMSKQFFFGGAHLVDTLKMKSHGKSKSESNRTVCEKLEDHKFDFETEGIVHPDVWTFSFHTHLKDKNQTTAVACDNDRISLNRRNRFPGSP